MRVPRMQGFPKQTLGSIEIRCKSGFILWFTPSTAANREFYQKPQQAPNKPVDLRQLVRQQAPHLAPDSAGAPVAGGVMEQLATLETLDDFFSPLPEDTLLPQVMNA